MGLLTKTAFEALTDKLARRIIAAVETPSGDMLAGNTTDGLTRYLDTATEDPFLQAALLRPAAEVDRQALGPGLAAYLNDALDNTVWASFCSAIASYVTSEEGGSYASLAAYLSAVGATVHPLVAEVFRKGPGAGVFTTEAGTVVGAMHPQMVTFDFDRVYVGSQDSLVDETTDLGNPAGSTEVEVFTLDNDVVALGSRRKFSAIGLDIATLASADVGLTVYYWNGTAWAELSVTDRTTGFSVNGGLISWTIPADWEPCNMDMQGTPEAFDATQMGAYYYLILQRTEDTVVTPPEVTWFQAIPEPVTFDGRLFGIEQPPLALVRITGENLCEVTVLNDAAWQAFVCPGVANNELKLLALTDIGASLTFTLGYVDQDGNAATKAQTAWSAPNAGDTKNLTLATNDTGVRAIDADTCAITTTATSGVFAIVANDYPRAIGAK